MSIKKDGIGKAEGADASSTPPSKSEEAGAQLSLASSLQKLLERTLRQLRGMKVTINGRIMVVLSETLENLMQNPDKTAEPEMVAPMLAARNRLTILSAREKMGKSTFAAWVASRVSSGGTYWGHSFQPGRVLWCGLEEHCSDAVRRFMAMNADGKNVAIVDSLGADPVLQLQAELAAFRPDLCVIDSLSRFCVGLDDENSAPQVNKFLTPLVEVVRNSGTAFLLLHHGAKKTDGYRGSTAIGAQVDMILNMTAPSETSSARSVTAKGRFKLDDYSLYYDLDAMTYDLLPDSSPETVAAAEKARMRRRILAFLAANPGTTSTALRSAMRGRATDVDSVRVELLAEGLIEQIGAKEGYRLRADP